MVETEVVKESYSGEFTTKNPLFFFFTEKATDWLSSGKDYSLISSLLK